MPTSIYEKEIEMTTKKIFASLLLTASSLCSAAPVDNKTHLAMQLLDAMQMSTMMKGMTDQMRGMFEKQFAAEEKCDAAKPIAQEFAQKFSDQLMANSDDFKADIGAIYAEVYSEDELKQLVAFYQSPLGKKMQAHMPELMQKSMQISQDRVRGIQPQIQKLTADYAPRIREAAKTCSASAATPNASQK
jgi:hypothetical protein